MMKFIGTILTILIFVSLNACAIKVMTVNPSPNVDIEIKDGLTLDLDEQIKDELEIKRSRLKSLQISGWRASLSNGFKNAFGNHSNSSPKYILQLRKADPEHQMTEGAVNRYGDLISAAIIVQITYQARLTDSDGNVLKRSVNTVRSKKSSMSPNETPDLVESAIESMYENIANDIF